MAADSYSMPATAPVGTARTVPPRRVGGLGTAVTVGLVAIVVMNSAYAVHSWWFQSFVADVWSGERPSRADIRLIDGVGLLVSAGYGMSFLAAGVLFVVWLWRARRNAETICTAQHRRRRGWIIGGWICPIVNLWFPKQIVDDVWRASDPSLPAVRMNLDAMPKPGLVYAWWTGFLLLNVGDGIVARITEDTLAAPRPTPDDARLLAWLDTGSAAGSLVVAVLAIGVVSQVSRWQDARVPWPG